MLTADAVEPPPPLDTTHWRKLAVHPATAGPERPREKPPRTTRERPTLPDRQMEPVLAHLQNPRLLPRARPLPPPDQERLPNLATPDGAPINTTFERSFTEIEFLRLDRKNPAPEQPRAARFVGRNPPIFQLKR